MPNYKIQMSNEIQMSKFKNSSVKKTAFLMDRLSPFSFILSGWNDSRKYQCQPLGFVLLTLWLYCYL